MYDRNSKANLWQALLSAGLGAGIVTSFTIASGQDPLVGLSITVSSALFAALCYLGGAI
jgi:hypothetical protein